jgi:hypothetical protein
MAGWWTPDRQYYAYNYLRNAGLPSVSAAALVSRWLMSKARARGLSILTVLAHLELLNG